MFDSFLILDGVKGESKDSKHTESIDVLSWSWGANQPGTMHKGSGGGTGKASFNNISLTKNVDKSSPTLWKYLAKGWHFPSGKIITRKAGGEQLEYMVVELSKVLITDISFGGSKGEDEMVENVDLNFAEFKISYTPQKEDGTGDAAIEFAWSVEENVEK